jgi:hypothetical protein
VVGQVRRLFDSGAGVFEAMKPEPMAGCITNQGAATVASPKARAGSDTSAARARPPLNGHQQAREGDADEVVRQPAQTELEPTGSAFAMAACANRPRDSGRPSGRQGEAGGRDTQARQQRPARRP